MSSWEKASRLESELKCLGVWVKVNSLQGYKRQITA